MKRVVVILMVLLIILTGVLYVGISSTQSFSKSVVVACTNEGALRVLVNERNSKMGWPGEKINDSTFLFEDLQYVVGSTLINVTDLLFVNKGKATFIVEERNLDTSGFIINYVSTLPMQPLDRIKIYLQTRSIQSQIERLLTALKKNFDGEELVYGIKIQKDRVADTAMISTKTIMNHYPSPKEVYDLIDAIRNYIKTNGGEETSAPMLNVYEESTNQYLVMVAVPTKTIVNGTETFLLKRMLANGFMLVSDVTGGNSTIQQAEKAMKQYVTDHHKSSPAIPFQMLLTDRRAEPDTTKWKTRLYYPVMY